MAQLVARFVRIEEVRSSNLLSSTTRVPGLAEQNEAIDQVTEMIGSGPLSRIPRLGRKFFCQLEIGCS